MPELPQNTNSSLEPADRSNGFAIGNGERTPASHPPDGLSDPGSPPAAKAPTDDLGEAAESARAAGPKAPPRGTSRLGLLAMLLGVAACVLCRRSLFPPREWRNPVLPAAVGLALALLALVAKVLGSRTRLGAPILGLLLCLAGAGIAGYQAGVRDVDSGRTWVAGQAAQIKKYVPHASPAAPAASRPTPPGLTVPKPPVGPAAPVAGSATLPGAADGTGAERPGSTSASDGIGAGTIFDMQHGTGATGATPRPSPGPTGPAGTPPPSSPAAGGTGAGAPHFAPGATVSPGRFPGTGGVAPRPSATANPRVQAALRAVQAADARVRAAEDDFRFAYTNAKATHPDYLAAEAEVQAADQLVADAKRRSDGFGTPLIEATNRRKEAQEKASRVVNEAMSRDPRVVAARRELSDAEASLRAAYEALPAAR